jgi:hypothetical protein
MFHSYESSQFRNPPKLNWEERFYKALLGGPDPRENCFTAEEILYRRLSGGETAPMSNEERSAMDRCLSDLRQFQVQVLNYPPIEKSVQETNLLSEEDLIEDTFSNIVGRPMLMRERPFFLRNARMAQRRAG